MEGTEVYANSWEYSDVRSFLNGEFFDLAFNEEEKALVQEQTLDNTNTTAKTESKYATAQTETQDMVFLLSYSDLRNTGYGFTTVVNYDLATSGEKTNDMSDPTVAEAMYRRRSYTDYAAINGVRGSEQAYTLDGEPSLAWMLRSSGSSSTTVWMVSKYGSLDGGSAKVDDFSRIGNSSSGIVPAVRILLKGE